MQYAYSKDHDLEGNCATLPPSFTTLLAGACIAPKKGMLTTKATNIIHSCFSSFKVMFSWLDIRWDGIKGEIIHPIPYLVDDGIR